jgi:molybdopterin converting factor small subunit
VRVRVLLFARPREVVGESVLDLEVPDGSTPRSVFSHLCEGAPALTPMSDSLRCAIDQEYAGWEEQLGDGVELAFIPPTAGG